MYGSPCRTGGNRACKSKAQSGALLRVGGAVVPFCLGLRPVEKDKWIEPVSEIEPLRRLKMWGADLFDQGENQFCSRESLVSQWIPMCKRLRKERR